jgi:site-specific DNA-cytosine methylase
VTKLVIDVCAGLGGFSQAFKDDPEYEVVTIEVNKKQRPTICADVRYLPLKKDLAPVLLLQSPPCNHFSLACLQFPRVGVKQALEVVGACFEAVAWLKPKRWLIENPRGRLRHIIGKPPQTVRYSDYDSEITMMKTTDFWGNIMLPMVKHERRIHLSSEKDAIKRLHKNFPHGNKYEKAERAKIPMGVSQAILEAVSLC